MIVQFLTNLSKLTGVGLRRRVSEKSSCPDNFLPTILGPEMAAPILWAPGKIPFFLQENRHAIKFLVLGGVFWVWEVLIVFLWAQGFSGSYAILSQSFVFSRLGDPARALCGGKDDSQDCTAELREFLTR